MEWPFRRFQKAYDSYQRGLICDELRERKNMHLAAVHANTNLDDEKADRASVVERVSRFYDDLSARIWNGDAGEEDAETEAAWESDFMQRGRAAVSFSLPGETVIGALPDGG